MRTRYALVALFLSIASFTTAQYCSPTFANGCFNWHNMAITAGSINWAIGSDDCTIGDYTTQSTLVNAGDALAMTVENGVWCGCAVWVDLDNSQSFEDSENLFYEYNGAQPSQVHSFSINIPVGTPTGNYRMRIISPWGSDGFNPGDNGSGPCGSYQYGNFTDLTLNVNGAQGVQEQSAAGSISIQVAEDMINVAANGMMERVTVRDAQGRVVIQEAVRTDRVSVGTAAWSAGIYFVEVGTPERTQVRRVMISK